MRRCSNVRVVIYVPKEPPNSSPKLRVVQRVEYREIISWVLSGYSVSSLQLVLFQKAEFDS